MPSSSPNDDASFTFDGLREKISGVEGWFYDGEAWELAKLPHAHPGQRPLTVVEIGSWKGRSTICLAFGMQNRAGMIYAIDPHMPAATGHAAEYGDVDTFGEFLSNVARAGFSDAVTPLRMTSAEAATRFDHMAIDVLFIDGAHEYEYVVDDIRRYVPRLSDIAFVAFNDPSRPGVFRALQEEVLGNDAPFFEGRLVQNSVFFTYERNRRASRSDLQQKRRFRTVLGMRFAAARWRKYMPMPFVRFGHRVSAMLAGTAMERT